MSTASVPTRASLTRKQDEAGVLIEEMDDSFEELDPIEVFLPANTASTREQVVPVTLETYVTETGMLELWCVASDNRRWKIEFNVRERYGS